MRAVKAAAQRVSGYVDFVRAYREHLPAAFGSIFAMRCRVVQLRGRVKGTGRAVTLVYAGRDMNYDYLVRIFLDDASTQVERRCMLWSCRRHAESLFAEADVLVEDLGWPYNGKRKDVRSLEVPDWLNMELDLTGEWGDVLARFRSTARRNDLRILRRNDYRYTVTAERRAAEAFYDDMYVPYITERHGTDAVIEPRRHVLNVVRKGALLTVYGADCPVAAGVLYATGGALCFLWMGLPRHLVGAPPEGAISALYYYGIKHAHERGYEAVEFMGTRPFLVDGAFRFKRKWGPVLEDTFSPNSVHIRPQPGNENAVFFCRRFPVIARTEAGTEAVFVAAESPFREDAFRARWEEVGCRGVDRVTVVEIVDENETIETITWPDVLDGCELRLVRTRLQTFDEAYSA